MFSSHISKNEEVSMLLVPAGAQEIRLPLGIPQKELEALKAALEGKHQEARKIKKLWWHNGNMGYYVLIDTAEDEASQLYFIPLASVVAHTDLNAP